MDHFPPEIWEQVFIFACTDSGRTGRSLSLVSRYFHNVSRSYRYQSVSLTRARNIPLFRNTLSHAPLEARRIKYLYVCCPNVFLDYSDEEDPDYVDTSMTLSSRSGSNDSMEVGSDSSGGDYEGSPTPEELEEVLDDSIALKASEDSHFSPQGCNDDDTDLHIWDKFDEDVQAADAFVLEAFRDILREASSSLLILSVNWTSFRPLLLEELLLPLPNLVELHLCRTFTSQDEIDPESEQASPTLFPRLRRLHIFGYVDQRPDSFGQNLGRIAPTLTHIRMPNHYIRRFPSESSRFPDTVEKVVLETFLASELLGTLNTTRILFGPGNHSKEIEFAVRSWRDDPKGWEKSWLERVMGLSGPW